MTLASTLRQHWPEYLIEGALLGLFMVSACGFTVLLEHPDSPARQAIAGDAVRRALIGVAMGLTAIALIYSPWGQRSGAHMNPAVTLTFMRRGKVKPWNAVSYIAAQFAGGLGGVWLSKLALGPALAHPAVNHAVTTPGAAGVWMAFFAEAVIACGMMLMVLTVSNTPKFARFTGICAGILVALYITFEAPLSGMSMNPARTFASALPSGKWTALWIYFTAPLLGMFAANELHRAFSVAPRAGCAKMHHGAKQRCIFCGYPGRWHGPIAAAARMSARTV
jgi:aquaporin Z